MTYPHAGIRIDRIPAEEGGGLIFAVGTAAIFLIAFPVLVPDRRSCARGRDRARPRAAQAVSLRPGSAS